MCGDDAYVNFKDKADVGANPMFPEDDEYCEDWREEVCLFFVKFKASMSVSVLARFCMRMLPVHRAHYGLLVWICLQFDDTFECVCAPENSSEYVSVPSA